MKSDVALVKSLGADGVVLGILTPSGEVDLPRTRELVELGRPMSVTFHRAFDMTCDPFRALEDLVGLGIDRVLTSGQEPSVIEGLDLIAELVRRAGNRLAIMPGGGTERNIGKVVSSSGAREVHVTGLASAGSPMRFRNTRVFMGGELRPPEYERLVTDPEKIRDLRKQVVGAGY
jgi:copper homeostasis protein